MEIRVEGVSFMIELRCIFWVFLLKFYWKNKCSVFNQLLQRVFLSYLKYKIKWIIIDYWCLNWVHLVIKMPNLENLEFYTCTLLDHNAKFLIMAYRRNSWVPNYCILVGINETK